MATNDDGLTELIGQITRLSSRDQFRLLELVLAEHRRQREETVAWILASQAELLEFEKQQREANDPVPFPQRAKREAG